MEDLDLDLDLDKEVEDLFADLGEADAFDEPLEPYSPGLSETLLGEEQRVDALRVLLVDFVYEIARFVSASRRGVAEDVKLATGRLMEVLTVVDELPDHDNQILLRHQGRGLEGEGTISEQYDYVLTLGNIRLDLTEVKAAIKRLEYHGYHTAMDFRNALKTISAAGVNTLRVYTGVQLEEERTRLEKAFTILSDYLRASAARQRPAIGDPRWGSVPVIHDDRHEPDINLTLLAAVNNLKPGTAQGLMNKIAGLMNKADPKEPLAQFPSIYNAAFAFKKMRELLRKSPIEVNNPRWLVAAQERTANFRLQSMLARFVSDEFGQWSQEPTKIMDCIYANDYGYVSAYHLADRLELATELLSRIESRVERARGSERPKVKKFQRIAVKNVLENLGLRLERVQGDVFQDLDISEDSIKARISRQSSVKRFVDKRILDMVVFQRQRSITKKKVKAMLRHDIEFGREDYANIARDFSITQKEAKNLVDLIRGCHDTEGHFIRKAFEENIPEFAKHGGKVFEFLWHYLKENGNRQDRVALLNALQLFIDQMGKHQDAVQVLLEDFLHDPETVQFSDRNALMLINTLVRKFNKELHRDIHMTPAEVLKVKEGLDEEAAVYTREFIAREKERFSRKVMTVHKRLKESLNAPDDSETMPVRYLFTLEWETYILLSLVGGMEGLVIAISALREYCNPESEVYKLRRSQNALVWLLPIIQVLIRGLARLGDANDVTMLHSLKSREAAFKELRKDPQYWEQVQRVMRLADETIDILSARADDRI
ncbi:MAG: hypothetical protein ACLFOY_10420 [Desulfatibacillaceae bacterium]